MHEYDVTLKSLLSESAGSTLRLIGASERVVRWRNVELPRVRNQRVDLLAELESGKMLHIELQNRNLAAMPQRMLEYAVAIWQLTGVFPRQIVLYVGNERMRMANGFQAEGIDYRYELVDIRDLDGEVLLESDSVSDNILASLTGIQDKSAAIRRIMGKIARLEADKRETAMRKLLILCGMRGLEKFYEQEERKMPIDLDIMEHKILGPAIRKGIEQGRQVGLQEGRQVGLQEGRQEGRREGTAEVVRRQIEKRFGVLPGWADQRLQKSSREQSLELAMKLLDARSLEELFD